MNRYLNRLKKSDEGSAPADACVQGRQMTNHQNLQSPVKGGFDSFVGRSDGTRAHSHPAASMTPTDTAALIRASRWLLHYPDNDPLKVICYPEATHAEMLAWYPDAVAAEPFTPTIRQPSAPMAAAQEAAIRAWLAQINETDPATIAEVIERCHRDVNAREYFTGRAAAELPKPDRVPDDRRTCDQCANLIGRRCQAARRGEIVASRHYEPIRNLPRRCEGYAPGAADTDRRPGRERWPELIQKDTR